jgi:hypothetical protein
MPTKRNAALYFELNFPSELWNEIPTEVNRHGENSLKENKDYTETVYIVG